MERNFIPARHLIFPVLLLVPQSSALFMTSLSKVLHCQPILQCLLLLDIRILIYKKSYGDREGGRYRSTTRGYCNGRLTNGKICLKITLFFEMDILGSTTIPTAVRSMPWSWAR